MLRLIIHVQDCAAVMHVEGAKVEHSHKTFDVHAPEAEAFLSQHTGQHMSADLIGFELVGEPEPEPAAFLNPPQSLNEFLARMPQFFWVEMFGGLKTLPGVREAFPGDFDLLLRELSKAVETVEIEGEVGPRINFGKAAAGYILALGEKQGV